MAEQTRLRLFDEQISRKPNNYPWTKEFVDAMHHGHWTSADFDFHSDKIDFYSRINDQERAIVSKALSAISQVEIAVKTFWAKLGDNLPHPGIRDMGYVMANIEVIHNDAYSRLLEVLGLDDIFEENLKLDIVAGRVNYLRKYTHRFYQDSKKHYIYAIILFTLFVENVSLFSQFYIVMHFYKNKNILKQTGQQIKYTCREEHIHALAGIKIINTLREEYPDLFDNDLAERVKQECVAAFTAESKIVDWMLGDYAAPGMDASILKSYIKNRINTSMKDIGYEQPFGDVPALHIEQTAWLDGIVLGNMKTDFFHAKPTDYNKRKITEKELF